MGHFGMPPLVMNVNEVGVRPGSRPPHGQLSIKVVTKLGGTSFEPALSCKGVSALW